MVTTAGNVDFRSTVGNADLDRLVVSCDGSRQEAYEQYRRFGSLQKVIQFMRDAKAYGSKTSFLEWKYILFEFNDSDADILAAQRTAEDIGVDSLLFIITNSKWHSERFTIDDSAALIPIVSPIASISPAAAMNKVVAECAPFSFEDKADAPLAHIDRCTYSVGKFLTVEGWALGAADAYADLVELYVDGQLRGRTQPRLRRTDVLTAYPGAPGDKSGFMFRLPIDPAALPRDIRLLVRTGGGAAWTGGPADWQFPNELSHFRKDMPVFDLALAAQRN